MLRPVHGGLLAVFVGLSPVVLGGATGDGTRCNLNISPAVWWRAETILLASATRDTMLAGPGEIEPSPHVGHTGPGGTGPIHGQVFVVERFKGLDSARLASAFAQMSEPRAFIVPWDYDEMCRPTRWTASGPAWVPTGEQGTFTVKLRPDSLWIEGTPVFDAFYAAFEPYPWNVPFRDDVRSPTRPPQADRMSAEDYFALLSVLPLWEDMYEHPDSAQSAFAQSRREHPDLARLHPANAVDGFLLRVMSEARGR